MIYQIVLAFTLFYYSMAEIYSSTAHIKLELLRVRQDKSIEMLKHLLDNQESSDLTHMKTLIETLDQLEADAKNPNFTVLHPLDAYRFIRNHSVIFNETVTQLVEEMQKNGYAHAEIIQLTQNLTALPKDDLIGALRGIIRIQHTYGIKAKDLAEGNVLGEYRREMTAAECKDMMIIAFYSDQIMLALDWLEIAIERIEAGDKTATVTALLCKAAASAFNIKRKAEAVIIYEYVVEQNPKNRYFKHKMRYYQNNTKQDVFKFVQHTNNFRNDCRKYLEEPEQNTSISNDLFCTYVDNGHPLLIYQPGKMEIISSDPQIFVFHDTFTPKIISTFLKQIVPYLQRSTVNVNKTSSSISEHRTSKGASFHSDGIIAKLYNYVGALTSLRWESFENFQIANYGIGGHYETHHDTKNPGKIETIFSGNHRIATFMIYLTDVEKGGATVFPQANLSVLPKAGKAVFWYNLNPDGNPCDETRHGACPVIIGDKYIANIWIREHGQEFTRPCNLDQNDTKYKWPKMNIK